MQIPKRQSEQHRKYGRRDDDYYLTAEAINRLRRNLEELQLQRPKVVEELSRARDMGDLSENAAYHDAKSRLGNMDGRIFGLKERLKNAVLIEPDANASGIIQIGSTVILEIFGKQKSYQILGSQETNPAAGRISYISPLGSALMGHRAGDSVTVKTQDREIVYQVKEVR